MGKLRVGVIFGGRSGEHEVSLVSARSVMAAMDKDKYEIIPIGITKEGRWVLVEDIELALETGLQKGVDGTVFLLGDPSQKGLLRLKESAGVGALSNDAPMQVLRLAELDVVFPVLHGPYGEDGTLQGLLEMADIPYVGAGVLASALGMDKAACKQVLRAAGLPVVEHLVFKRRDWELHPLVVIQRVEEHLGYPCFVKPANLGSSVGVSKARDQEQLQVALNDAARYDRKLLVEQAINAREIEVSVLGNDEPEASIPGEIVPCREFYDYVAKYIDDRSELLIPAPLSPALTEQVRDLAVRAYRAIDCAGMARVDFLMDRNTEALYVSELNTIPGFTPISMYPKLWEASGLPYPRLIDRLIELALERHADKSRNLTSYTPPEGER